MVYFKPCFCRIPIADIFQTKKRKKRQAVPEYQYDYSDIWGDEYPEEAIWEEYPEETLPSSFNSIQRINFAKYGRGSNDKNTSDTKDEVTDALPDNIYCDLVTTDRKSVV